MGVIRILLALAVVLGHSGASTIWQGTGGIVAVQTFFIISGFYIAMTLSTAYRDADGRFWFNRALRLYPLYLVVALISLLGKGWTQPGLSAEFHALPLAAQGLLVVSNSLIFGQDWVMFAGVRDGALAFFSDFRESTPQLYRFLVSPPAWSLGTELSFYVLAPFLFRLRTRTLLMVAAASLALRFALMRAGLAHDPWTYRFFPTELALFLAGGLAWRVTPWVRGTLGAAFRPLCPYATWLVIGLIVAYGALPGYSSGLLKASAFYLVFLVCLPFVFAHSRSNRTDRAIGDLSYPLYISHWVTLEYLTALLGAPQGPGPIALRVLAALAVAWLLCRIVDAPVQRIRDLVRAATAAARAPIREPWPTTLR
jgi:peptidoglycan/LPS O-acetylase OafA/YrhL